MRRARRCSAFGHWAGALQARSVSGTAVGVDPFQAPSRLGFQRFPHRRVCLEQCLEPDAVDLEQETTA